MRMGMISDRRRRRRAARMRRRLMIAAGVLLLGALAMAPGLKEKLRSLSRDVQAFTGGAQQAELTLPEREVYALQLAVFDSGERAASEARRLQAKGVRCIVWQREKMRIVSSVALSREELDWSSAKGHEGYVIREMLSPLTLRLSCSADAIDDVRTLLQMPDIVLKRLLAGEETLASIVKETGEAAERAVDQHPEHALYTQLAQSLINWCALMERTGMEANGAHGYAALTMCTLCRELRTALQGM